MFHLDYWSCLLTVLSTILVGRKLWFGLVVAAVNCVLVCVIGFHTGQYGFIPANLFCIVAYVVAVRSWRRDDARMPRGSNHVPVPASAFARTDRLYLVLNTTGGVHADAASPRLLNIK